MSKKVLKIEVEEVPETVYTYNYSFIDTKGFRVLVEGLPNMDEVEKNIKGKIKGLSNESHKIVKKI